MFIFLKIAFERSIFINSAKTKAFLAYKTCFSLENVL